MKECLICKQVYEDTEQKCKKDRSPIKPSLPGSTIIGEKYQLEQKIGQGSLGGVYQGISLEDNSKVTIKIISPEILQSAPKALEVFFKEAEANKKSPHPNLVKVLDYGQSSENYLYLVMEYIEGLSLETLLKQENTLDLERAIDLMSQTCDAVDFLHKQGRTHQDLRPSKIYIVYDDDGKEQVKLLDTGLGRIKWKELVEAFPGAKESLFSLPYYQSPEQFSKGYVSCNGEVYSLGAIFYRMMSGIVPFEAKTYDEMMEMHQHRAPASLWSKRRDISETLDTFVLLALSKEPESRIQTVSAFKSCLKIATDSKNTVRQKPVINEEDGLLASMTLLNMPAVSSNATYVPDAEDYVSSTSESASQEVKEVINTVTRTMEVSQLPTVFGRQRVMVTVGIMLGLLLAALEVTIVATAMPKVVASLGGFSSYSWVFSIYLLTSTIGMPIWGKMSDLYGRRICYQVGITIFLIGSVLCGMATTMNQLILCRAIQGLGGGALIPLALTVIGDIYMLQERPKMQAVISGIWGFSSVVGPLLGGFLTDYSSWRWIFFLNVPLGIIAFVILTLNMKEPRKQQIKPKVDIAGAITLTLTIALLLVGCLKSEAKVPPWISTTALISSVGMLALFIRIEQKASEPILPLWLFREKIFLATVLGNLFAGCMLFGSMPFITLFAQAVLNSSATKAGTVLMPLILGWVSLSVIGVKLMLKSGFRKSIIIGQIGIVLGFSLLTLMTLHLSKTYLYISMAIVGMGMGLALTALIIAVQSSMPKNQLGIVTSSAIFFRNIGGSIGATVMGALLSSSIARALLSIPPEITSSGYKGQLTQLLGNINMALDPSSRASISAIVLTHFRTIIAGGIQVIFIFCLIISIAAFASSLLVPPDKKQSSA